jgi:hypothetical protein
MQAKITIYTEIFFTLEQATKIHTVPSVLLLPTNIYEIQNCQDIRNTNFGFKRTRFFWSLISYSVLSVTGYRLSRIFWLVCSLTEHVVQLKTAQYALFNTIPPFFTTPFVNIPVAHSYSRTEEPFVLNCTNFDTLWPQTVVFWCILSTDHHVQRVIELSFQYRQWKSCRCKWGKIHIISEVFAAVKTLDIGLVDYEAVWTCIYVDVRAFMSILKMEVLCKPLWGTHLVKFDFSRDATHFENKNFN